jgi:hypothetical protein
MSKRKVVPLLTVAAAAIGFVAAIVTTSVSCDQCAVDCPPTTVYIGSPDNHELNGILVNLDVRGEACPPLYSVTCVGDRYTTTCTHLTITGQQAGACDVLFVFSDRPNEILHLQFGKPLSCCRGYPVQGPSYYTIPDKPTGPIYSGGNDAGPIDTDAVTIVTDAAPATDAATDAGSDAY